MKRLVCSAALLIISLSLTGCGGRRGPDVSISKDAFKVEGFTVGDSIDNAYDHFKDKFGARISKDEDTFTLSNGSDQQCTFGCGLTPSMAHRIGWINLDYAMLPGYNKHAIAKEFEKKKGLRTYGEDDYVESYLQSTFGIEMQEEYYFFTNRDKHYELHCRDCCMLSTCDGPPTGSNAVTDNSSTKQKGKVPVVVKVVPMTFTADDVKTLLAKASNGDAEAQCKLGVYYVHGNGNDIAQDYTNAVKWFRKAAEQGNPKAQFLLGACYFGYGVAQDYTNEFNWYRKAAEQGYADAQCALGNCYHNGEGVPKDYDEAIRWYRKAAQQGNAASQCNLGNAYADGIGVTKDQAEAIKWMRKAADQGDINAQYNLGSYYEHGKGVTQDIAEAKAWFKKAADQGDTMAQDKLKELGK